MTGNLSIFQDLRPSKGFVSYGSGKGKILGIGTIGKSPMPLIHNVSYVEGLNFNLLSISQFCDSGYEVSFNKDECIVRNLDKIIISLVNERIIFMRLIFLI